MGNRSISSVRIYDNGGKTVDRYTAVYMDCPETRPQLGTLHDVLQIKSKIKLGERK